LVDNFVYGLLAIQQRTKGQCVQFLLFLNFVITNEDAIGT